MPTINVITKIPGPKSEAILERRKNATPAGLAKSTEVVVARAEGGVVWDVDGNTLLDFAGGIGMINVGHRPQQVVDAIKEQLDKYIHTCSLVTTFEPYVELAEMLNRLTPGAFAKKTLLCNTGTEAVENAVMLAKYYTRRPAVICFEGAYHGRSLLTLSLTSKYSLFKKGYGSFASDIYRLPAPNVYRTPNGMSEDEYLQWCIKNLEHAFIAQVDPESVAAIIIEPVLGEGGFIQMPTEFMQKIRELCDKHGIVMIADEIQSGSGRTGKLFAIEHTGVVPDVMTIAKSLGAGMPVSAVIGKAEIMDCTHLGGVGGTYGGSPVAAVAAIEALKILSSKEFLNRSTHVGQLIKSTLDTWKEKFVLVGDVRATGAMCIVEFVKDRDTKEPDMELPLEVLKDAVAHGIILIRAGLYSNCIRLLPPIVMTNEQLHEGLKVLEDAIARAHEKRRPSKSP
jgi:4-aminobutyrate aminotransferase / (S)-3-amino-2-methylpropionate transaminase / 5-aminovalerate transaminase